jgi:hypothetical protein
MSDKLGSMQGHSIAVMLQATLCFKARKIAACKVESTRRYKAKSNNAVPATSHQSSAAWVSDSIIAYLSERCAYLCPLPRLERPSFLMFEGLHQFLLPQGLCMVAHTQPSKDTHVSISAVLCTAYYNALEVLNSSRPQLCRVACNQTHSKSYKVC